MKIVLTVFVTLGVTLLLSGCANQPLKAPCPDFGKWCEKTPINSWNYNS